MQIEILLYPTEPWDDSRHPGPLLGQVLGPVGGPDLRDGADEAAAGHVEHHPATPVLQILLQLHPAEHGDCFFFFFFLFFFNPGVMQPASWCVNSCLIYRLDLNRPGLSLRLCSQTSLTSLLLSLKRLCSSCLILKT